MIQGCLTLLTVFTPDRTGEALAGADLCRWHDAQEQKNQGLVMVPLHDGLGA